MVGATVPASRLTDTSRTLPTDAAVRVNTVLRVAYAKIQLEWTLRRWHA